jgi:hypothetical protein
MFSPAQIICIDRQADSRSLDQNLLLLAEVIQMVPERDRCWARPLALAQSDDFQLTLRHDLRDAPQLILPAHLFREALDTEVLPLMTELFQWDKPESIADRTAQEESVSRQALHTFIRDLLADDRSVA